MSPPPPTMASIIPAKKEAKAISKVSIAHLKTARQASRQRSLKSASCQILKAGVLAQEGQAHRARGTVTLLADNDFGHALIRCIGFVVILPVHHEDHVGILLDGAG